MNWENLEEILKIQEKDFEKEAEKTQTIDLDARILKIQDILNKKDLGYPALIGSEVMVKRKQLTAIQHILIATRDRKLKETDEQHRKTSEKWKEEALKENLHDIRYAVGSSVEHLRQGTFTMDAVEWFKPQSTEFEVPLVSGGKMKINLLKLISPTTLQMLLEKTFSPIYLTIEAQGGYDKHGKRMGYYMSPDWNESHRITIKMGTLMAIMKV